MATSCGQKFLLLMWKNFLLQWRHPIGTCVEIFSPVLFTGLLVLIRSLVEPTLHADTSYFREFKVNNTPPPLQSVMSHANLSSLPTLPLMQYANFSYAIIHSPKSTPLDDIMRHVKEAMKLSFSYGFDSREDMNKFMSNINSKIVLCAIQFDTHLANKDYLTPYMNVTIRYPPAIRFAPKNQTLGGLQGWYWHTNRLFWPFPLPGPRNPDSNDGGAPEGYNNEYFLGVQQEISYAIINKFREKPLNSTDLPNITMQRFPYPPYTEDDLLAALLEMIGIIIMLTFTYTCISTVKFITTEKEKQLKEAMKIMGLPNWLHWTAWFIKTLCFMLISGFIIVVLMKINWVPGSNVSIFTNSDATAIYFFLIVYLCTTITFCFMVSVFFSKANTASTVAGLLWFFSYTPKLFMQGSKYDTVSFVEKLLACLGHNTAMALGFDYILKAESAGQGLKWSSMWRPLSPDDSLHIGHVTVMLVIDAFLYLLVTLYVEAVFPGEFGVPQPWYFPFTRTYWCGSKRFNGVKDLKPDEISNVDPTIYEAEPRNLQIGIEIKNLTKIFNRKFAVNNMNLNMYEGQITVLLGHNGAGKSTTMCMLTGIYYPTSGTAKIGGHDIIHDMTGVRQSLGICPQHNILFDDLTVEEHIYFYCKLKGLPKHQILQEIDKFIRILELEPKRKARSKTLSGGMKRKVSVCIALCGHSRVVVLDEPTAGMDPAARRALWDLLQEEKKNRTILLSTHFMDEADLLGDRIAIMSAGTIQCCGSSFFLKKRYGTGYLLTMEKAPYCDVMKVTELLRTYIPTIQVQSNIGSELTYVLSEDKINLFEQMLRKLESNTKTLDILNFGISLTTLEEVFMRVGSDANQEQEVQINGQINGGYDNFLDMEIRNTNSDIKYFLFCLTCCCRKIKQDLQIRRRLKFQNMMRILNEFEENNISEFGIPVSLGEKLLTGPQLYWYQFKAMMLKKALSTWRSWYLLLIQVILPVAFLAIAITAERGMGKTKDPPPLEVTLRSYDNPTTVISGDNSFKMAYKNYFKEQQYNLEDFGSADFESSLLNKYAQNLQGVRNRYIVGATFKKNESIKAWFNNVPLHSAPLTMNLIHNAVLRKELGENYNGHYIAITNYPEPFGIEIKLTQYAQSQSLGFTVAFNLGFSMAFVTSFYIIFYIRERVCKSKHLQLVSGANIYIFWITAYMWDMITFFITSLCVSSAILAFQEDGFKTVDEIGRLLLVLTLFGHSALPFSYVMSHIFSIPSTGFIRMTLFNIFTGVAGFVVVAILGRPDLRLMDIANILNWVFIVIPHYCLSKAVENIFFVSTFNTKCSEYAAQYGDEALVIMCAKSNTCCQKSLPYYTMEKRAIGPNMASFIGIGLAFFLLLLVMEARIFDKIHYFIKRRTLFREPPHAEDQDDDVARERKKIDHLTELEINAHHLVMKDLSKYYDKGFLAVHRLSVAIKGNECFGLLGVNGAGKTSTFKMLTGDEKISFGEVWVNGISLKSDIKTVHSLIGYCPQFDALLDDLTGRETLRLFCLLRGVPSHEAKYLIERLAKDFGFIRHLDKKVKNLSGGNKRKLSTAITLIGDPIVIYLDEPTTGMDPGAKRFLWNALCKVRDSGKCIILTSHSMEECEALCTRLAIMVNGTFKCLGSTQRLKSKFSEGYTLTIKIRKDKKLGEVRQTDLNAVSQFVDTKFPSAILREHYQELLTYYIEDKRKPWSEMFGIMENGKSKLPIEDYSLGQTSLEQVFLKFTKYQREE